MKKSTKKPVKKMMTGGMKNSNIEKLMTASDVRTRAAGSSGVTPKMNTAAQAQNTPGGTSSGGVNNVPTSAVPSKSNSKMYGGKMKMGGMKKGGTMMKKMGKKK
jgi:hypothetical protein